MVQATRCTRPVREVAAAAQCHMRIQPPHEVRRLQRNGSGAKGGAPLRPRTTGLGFVLRSIGFVPRSIGVGLQIQRVSALPFRVRANPLQYRYSNRSYRATDESTGVAVTAKHERPNHFRRRTAFLPTNDHAPHHRSNHQPIPSKPGRLRGN
jgi:hypothetical protein